MGSTPSPWEAVGRRPGDTLGPLLLLGADNLSGYQNSPNSSELEEGQRPSLLALITSSTGTAPNPAAAQLWLQPRWLAAAPFQALQRARPAPSHVILPLLSPGTRDMTQANLRAPHSSSHEHQGQALSPEL